MTLKNKVLDDLMLPASDSLSQAFRCNICNACGGLLGKGENSGLSGSAVLLNVGGNMVCVVKLETLSS